MNIAQRVVHGARHDEGALRGDADASNLEGERGGERGAKLLAELSHPEIRRLLRLARRLALGAVRALRGVERDDGEQLEGLTKTLVRGVDAVGALDEGCVARRRRSRRGRARSRRRLRAV